MNLPEDTYFLVFSDFDGSLLDHHTYSFQDALPQIYMLQRLGIPLIPATSKTRMEVERLRCEMGISDPFIVENGAAVFIPVGYFERQPNDTVERDGYWVCELAASRDKWLGLLADLYYEFPGEYDYFYRAGTGGVMRMTNLPQPHAIEANQREYSEPVQWLGEAERKLEFVSALQSRGAHILQGGRFLAVSGECDKGRALSWLRQVYQELKPASLWHDLAIGDSANDKAMLEAAETALVVRSPVHDFPQLSRDEGVIFSTDYGPAGWAEGVARWMHSYHTSE